MSTALVSNVNYFVDGVISGLTFGNASSRSITRNKRGQWLSLISGVAVTPVLSQTYGYDAAGLGELTEVNFLVDRSPSWTWTFGYDSLRRLTSYSTNVRPNTDTYTWSYDEVGNRNSEVYNGTTTSYTYDPSKNTSQLASISGGSARSWTYDGMGDVQQDHYQGGNPTLWNQYVYNTRHHLARLDYYQNSAFVATTEFYEDDGLERRWEKSNSNGTWVQYYYDLGGRLIQEYQNNNVTVNGCAAYDVINHVYLAPGANEVSRVVRRFQSSGGCLAPSYFFVDEDLRYIHEDYRHTVFGVEGKNQGGLVWEGEISPFGITEHEGLPGADGKIGTSDDLPYIDAETFGLQENYRDLEFTNLADQGLVKIPFVGRQIQPNPNLDLVGGSPYADIKKPVGIVSVPKVTQLPSGAGVHMTAVYVPDLNSYMSSSTSHSYVPGSEGSYGNFGPATGGRVPESQFNSLAAAGRHGTSAIPGVGTAAGWVHIGSGLRNAEDWGDDEYNQLCSDPNQAANTSPTDAATNGSSAGSNDAAIAVADGLLVAGGVAQAISAGITFAQTQTAASGLALVGASLVCMGTMVASAVFFSGTARCPGDPSDDIGTGTSGLAIASGGPINVDPFNTCAGGGFIDLGYLSLIHNGDEPGDQDGASGAISVPLHLGVDNWH